MMTTKRRLAVERDLLPDRARRWTARAIGVIGAVGLILVVAALFGHEPVAVLGDPMLWIMIVVFVAGFVIEDVATKRRPSHSIDGDAERPTLTDGGADQ